MKDSTEYVNELASEAAAFNQRISERRAIGFVPDIRRVVKSDYFYKSFWRDPHYVHLYLGWVIENHLAFLRKYAPPGRRSWMSDAELGILHSNWRGMDTMLLVSILLKRQSKPQGRPWQAIHTLKVLGRYDMRCRRY